MHIHYFTLRQIAAYLESKLNGAIVAEAFTQDKDELVIGLGSPEEDLWLRVSCNPTSPFVWPVDAYRKARKNVVELFQECYGLKVIRYECLAWERVILLHLEESKTLVLKMHGNRSNVLLMQGDKVISLFRNNLESDREYQPEPGTFQADWEAAAPPENIEKGLREISPALGKQFAERVKLDMAAGMDFKSSLKRLLRQAADEVYFLRKMPTKLRFMLFDPQSGQSLKVRGIAQALHAFLRSSFQFLHYAGRYRQVETPLKKYIKKYEGQIASHRKSIRQIENARSKEEMGSLLMANLHLIEKGMEQVELYDFYQDQQIKVRLDPKLNPQQNAARFYAGNKKNKARISHLQSQADQMETELMALLEVQEAFARFPKPEDLELSERGIDPAHSRDLAEFLKAHSDLLETGKPGQKTKKHPFMEFEREGFRILVGKNAKQNDELSFKYSQKQDLWLHARGVAGSHVIIRLNPGQQVPGTVLEFAASLAAHFSKSKNDSLAPVIYTEKKFVRKAKGGNPGQVIVEKEKVIMIEPLERGNWK